ncbi:MAG: peptide chain release factor N(5)-glutamine methyltransferase [Dyella sp.]
MTTVRQLLHGARARLAEPSEADWLLAHLLGRPRSWLIAHADDVLGSDQKAALEALLLRREGGEPVAYITGRQGFWSLELEVSAATLIPRPETELLVEQALLRLPSNAVLEIIDLGTGSGAIALALAKERPCWKITASDASAAALAVARRNAQRLQLGHVRFMEGDWLGPLAGQRFDAIISNPPYIEADDPHLQRGDLRFEPASALAAGPDGLDDIRRIVDTSRAHLKAHGWLLFEHGWNQGDAVRGLLESGQYTDVFTAKDLEGRDRVSGGRYG